MGEPQIRCEIVDNLKKNRCVEHKFAKNMWRIQIKRGRIMGMGMKVK
jgi:hypothetical protein